MGHSTRLPAAPLQAQLRLVKKDRGLSWEELADELGIAWRTLERLMKLENISETVAGRMALKLGLHEALLWPERDVVSLAHAPGVHRTCP